MSVRPPDSTSQATGISGFISNLKQRLLESTIGKIFCQALGIAAKTDSKITPLSPKGQEAAHTSTSQPPPTLTLANAHVSAPPSRQTSSSTLLPKAPTKDVYKEIPKLQNEAAKFHDGARGTVGDKVDKGKRLDPELVGKKITDGDALLKQVKQLEADAKKQGVESPAFDEMNKNIDAGVKLLKELKADLDRNQRPSREESTSAPHRVIEDVKPAPLAPLGPMSPLAKYAKSSNPPEKFRELANAFRENKERLPENELHAFAERFIQVDKDVQSAKGLSPMQIWRQIGATPDEVSHLVIECLSEIEKRGSTPGAAPAA